ncbi:MAG TPA: STAS domain-containing protein [Solirubrobacteraceae bacterium]|jgi:anti-anti-sigma factor|nr:STAS domain-containing protein [Solirubrobacteraceae bacterium]
MRESDPPFTLRVEGREGAVRVIATGELDPSTAPSVAAVLAQHRGEDMVVDLSRVRFADSSIVRTLVEERHHAHLAGSRFGILGANERVRRSFELSGVAHLFDWS